MSSKKQLCFPLLYKKGNEPIVSLMVYNYLSQIFGGEDKLNVKIQFKAGGQNVARSELKVLTSKQGDSIWGDESIAWFISKLNGKEFLFGNNQVLDESLVFQWVKEANTVLLVSIAKCAQRFLMICENHLKLRTFFVGYNYSLADFSVFNTIKKIEKSVQEGKPISAKLYPNLFRWKKFCELNEKQIFVEIYSKNSGECASSSSKNNNASSSKNNNASSSSNNNKGKSQNNNAQQQKNNVRLLTLENAAEGKVVTRFPPEPSGFMHLGHCKAALLNYSYAQQYKGKFILRFDDTNPAKAKQKFEDAIINDVKTLGIRVWKTTHTSDHFDLIIEHCRRMISKGDLYVDLSDGDAISAQRKALKPSPYRDQPVEENQALFEEMLKGTPKGLKCVVRAKMDYKSPVGCLRDPNMFRCAAETHYRTGKKYCAYPLYDFACPIIDSFEGVTHALRSNEYHDRNAVYRWMLSKTGVRPVHIHDFGRLSFSYTLLSKRKLQWFVDQNIVDDWDHPSFPTVRGTMRRGLTVDALRAYIVQQGSSKNIVLNDTLKLWAENRKVIDPIVPRYHCISRENIVKVNILNFPESCKQFGRSIPLHKKEPKLGKKTIICVPQIFIEADDAKLIKQGEKITLMDWGNAIVTKISKAESDDIVESIDVTLKLDDKNYRKTKKLTWVANSPDSCNVDLVEYDTLISKPKLDKPNPHRNKAGDKFEDFANRKLDYHTKSIGCSNLKHLKTGDKIQLERRGYFIVDKPSSGSQNSLLTLIKIPEGKLKDVSTVSSKITSR